MNREVTVKKVGKVTKLTNPCPKKYEHHEIMVGSLRCKVCEHFVKQFNKDGKEMVHCNYI